MKTQIKNGLKNLGIRIEFWLILSIIGVLIDEFIKEGYFFKLVDLVTLEVTHEKILLGLVILFIGWVVKRYRE